MNGVDLVETKKDLGGLVRRIAAVFCCTLVRHNRRMAWHVWHICHSEYRVCRAWVSQRV